MPFLWGASLDVDVSPAKKEMHPEAQHVVMAACLEREMAQQEKVAK